MIDATPLPPPTEGESLVRVADLGCGRTTPYFGSVERVRVTRFDADESVRPDYRCDLRTLPVEDGAFDVVHASHVLEHFGRSEVLRVLGEWVRVLRVGGELRLVVPNVLHAFERVLAMERGEAPPDQYPFWQIWGAQAGPLDVHRNGWTPRRLRLVLERLDCLGEITVQEADDGQNLVAQAVKVRAVKPYALVDGWDAVAAAEGTRLPGLAPKSEPPATA